MTTTNVVVVILIIIIVILVCVIIYLLSKNTNQTIESKKNLLELQLLYENKDYSTFEKKAKIFKNTNKEVNYNLANMYYHLKKSEKGKKAWNRYVLLGGNKLFPREHLKFFLSPLIRKKKYEVKPNNYKEKFYNSSPSLLYNKYNKNWLYNIRYVNYYPTNEFGNFIVNHPKDELHTHNVLSILPSTITIVDGCGGGGCDDKIFDKIKISTEIKDKYFINKECRFKSLEDMRIFALQDNNTLLFFATCLQTNMLNVPQICYGKIKLHDKTVGPTVTELYPMRIQKDPSIWEKNWLPFINGDKVNFIYQWEPLTIGCIDINPNSISSDNSLTGITLQYYELKLTYPKKIRNYTFENFRGSSPPIKYKNGFLCVVHIAIDSCERNRIYYHRLIWLTEKEIRVGDPFYFNNVAIEFNLSISILNNICYITNSDNDHTSIINEVDLQTVDHYLGF